MSHRKPCVVASDFKMMTIVVFCLLGVAMAHNGHDHTHDHEGHQMQSSPGIKLSIMYESLCPDSIAYFKDQLLPVMNDDNLNKYLDVDFYPYGKTEQWYSNNFQFRCHHGPAECYGNIVHACAAKHLFVKSDKVAYLGCLMKTVNKDEKNNATYPMESCGKGLDIEKIKECVGGNEGLMLLSEAGNMTSKLTTNLKSVPAVAVNNVYKPEDQKKLTENLGPEICSLLNITNSKLCSAGNMITATPNIIMVVLAALIFRKILP